MATLADILLGRNPYRSPVRDAVETPQPIDPNAQNAGPMHPLTEALLQVGGGKYPSLDDYANDKGFELGFGLTGGVKVPVRIPSPIRAFHGSPHDFNEFDLSKIGTGEGAQAYGHGLYFAEHEPVARSYRDNLAAQSQQYPHGTPEATAKMALDMYETIPEAVSGLRREARGSRDADAALFLRAADLLDSGKFNPGGRMYEVALHPKPPPNAPPDWDPRSAFLDWDKPLAGQSPAIKEAARYAFGNVPESAKLGSFDMPRVDEVNTKLLAEKGIPGIRYADQLSRGNRIGPSTPANDIARQWLQGHGGDRQKAIADIEDFLRSRKQDPAKDDVLNALKNWRGPTHNYVVWSPEIIEILRKYGIAGPAALGAIGAVTNKQNEQ